MMGPQVTEAPKSQNLENSKSPCFVGEQCDKADNLSVEEIKSIL